MNVPNRLTTSWRSRLLLVVASFGFTLGVAEFAFRITHTFFGVDTITVANMRGVVLRGESAHYSPRAFTNFGLRPGSGSVNDRGFLGWPSDHALEKPANVVRIACLGASTTQSGNKAGVAGSYPYQLERMLEREAVQRVEVMNFGVSGWTTAETLVNYLLTVRDYSPDIVIVHHSINDVAPRLYRDYRNDYTHFRTTWSPPPYTLWQQALVTVSDLGTWLLLHTTGTPHQRQFITRPRRGPIRLDEENRLDPTTELAFRRNVNAIAEYQQLRGGRTVFLTMPHSHVAGQIANIQQIGILDHNRILRELAAGPNRPNRVLVDAERAFPSTTDPDRSFFRDSVHVSPEGNELKARLVTQSLFAAGWLTARGS